VTDPSQRGTIGDGVRLGLLLHLLQFPIGALLALATSLISPNPGGIMMAFVPPMIIGLSQLAYMVPTIVYEFVEGRPEIAKGLIIVASATFLLNASCFGFVMSPLIFGPLRI
jgi:hypothetical protein